MRRINLSSLGMVQVVKSLTKSAFQHYFKKAVMCWDDSVLQSHPGCFGPLVELGQADGGEMPTALLLSQDPGVLDLAPAPRSEQFKASGGAGSKSEPGGWDTPQMGKPQLSGGGRPLQAFIH